MLNQLRLRNFKAWQESNRIRLAPLTVLFGSNSSGKTSILQLLLMLKQTAESPDRFRALHPGDSKTAVDLGTFQDLLFGHDLDRQLGFEIAWRLEQPLTVRDSKAGKIYRSHDLAFEAQIVQAEGQELRVERMSYTLGEVGAGGFKVGMQPEKTKYRLEAEGYDPVRNLGRKWPLPRPIRFYGFPDEAIAYFQNTGFLADLALELERLLRNIYYIGPLRENPLPQYVWSGEIPQDVGWRGERAVEAILAAQHRRIGPGYKKKTLPFEVVVARWLKKMSLIDSFRVKAVATGRKEYEVLVRSRRSSTEVRLTDVGFGVSQVLPVVVQCFYAPRNSTIILEQPEIHLHPSVQADLADLLIEAIRARENGKDRGIQLIVESHSEHFLRRLQRRVAEEAITPDEVAIYFCEPSPTGAQLSELKVNLFGDIENWPVDFFGDELGDLVKKTQAVARRRSQT